MKFEQRKTCIVGARNNIKSVELSPRCSTDRCFGISLPESLNVSIFIVNGSHFKCCRRYVTNDVVNTTIFYYNCFFY